MKKLAIVLASAIAFDLGTVVASSHAAVDFFLKLDGVQEGDHMKFRVDQNHTPEACMTHGGTVYKSGGQDYCNIPSRMLPESIRLGDPVLTNNSATAPAHGTETFHAAIIESQDILKGSVSKATATTTDVQGDHKITDKMAPTNMPTPINMYPTRASMGGSSLAAPGGKTPAPAPTPPQLSPQVQVAYDNNYLSASKAAPSKTTPTNAGIQSSYMRTICKTGETSVTREGKTTCIPSSMTSHETGDMPR